MGIDLVSIEDQETFNSVSEALDNCGYLNEESIWAAMYAVVECAQSLKLTNRQIDTAFEKAVGRKR